MIDKNVCFVKVLARGIIDKPLIVKAQDFSLDAAKMIQLTGGKVVLLNKKKY
ncbi:MAG: uL15 family ribosomal protein [Christensenellales bacterium]